MFKRISLLVATNVLIVATLTLLVHGLGLDDWLMKRGLNWSGLAVMCVFWGFGGAFISLAISRLMAKWTMGVKVIDPREPGQFRSLVDMVHRLSQKAGLPAMPEVGVYDSPEINAFATGPTRSRALVAVSSGLLRRMNPDEIEGVLGHEVAHIANGDMVTMTLIQGVVNAFVMFLARAVASILASAGRRDGEESSPGGSFMMVILLQTAFSFLGMFVVTWFSRYREYRADEGGARVAGKEKMIGALAALSRAYPINSRVEGPASVATLKISPNRGFWALLSTHPPIEERIARLQAAR